MTYDPRAIAQITARPTSALVEVLEGTNVILNVSGPGVGRFVAGRVLQLYPPETRRGGEIAQAFNTVDYLITAVAGTQLTGTLNPSDADNPPQVEKGWLADGRDSRFGILTSTRAGLQAAWDGLPARGGATLELPASTTVTSDGIQIDWSGKDDITVVWPSSFVLQAPANANPYNLLRIGPQINVGAGSQLVGTLTLKGAKSIPMVSVAGYIKDQVVLLFNGTNLELNRITYIDVAGNKLHFAQATAFDMTTAPASSVITMPSIMKGFRLLGRPTVKQGGNTNYGLKAGTVLSATTTAWSSGGAQDSYTAVFASFAGFADLDFVVVAYQGESWVKRIISHAGTTPTFDIPMLKPLGAGATMTKLTNGLSDLATNSGIYLSIMEAPVIEDFYGENIVGSALAGDHIYEGSIKGLAYNSGFAYQPGVVGVYIDQFAGALQFRYCNAVEWDLRSENAQSWGVWTDMLANARGIMQAHGSVARGVKHSYLRDPKGLISVGNDSRYVTGIAYANACQDGFTYNYAYGNGENGVWWAGATAGDANRMRVFVEASGNNISAAPGGADISVGATDDIEIVQGSRFNTSTVNGKLRLGERYGIPPLVGTYATTAIEQSLVLETVKGYTLGRRNIVAEGWDLYTNNAGLGAKQFTIRGKYGAAVVAFVSQAYASSAATRVVRWRFEVSQNGVTTNDQRLILTVGVDDGAGGPIDWRQVIGVGAIDSTLDVALAVTVQMDTSNAAITFTKETHTVRGV